MKNKRKTVLITCAGGSGPLYLAKKLSGRFNVVLVDADDQNVGARLNFPFYKVPFGNNPAYVPALRRIIKRHRVDIIVPGTDEELNGLAALREEMNLIGVFPNRRFSSLCINKKNLMTALAQHRISTLLPFRSMKSVRYPAVAKPIQGRGSRGMHILHNQRQLEGYLKLYGKSFAQVLVQPFASGVEYTVSVIVNNLNKVIGIVPKRIIVKRGITRAAVTERNKHIESACRKIVEHFNPCGPFNVQLKLLGGKVFIFEINPRLSTTAVLTEQAFGNEVELFVRTFNRAILPKFPGVKAPVFLYRYEENVFK